MKPATRLIPALLGLFLWGCGTSEKSPEANGSAPKPEAKVKIDDVKAGEGPAAANGDILIVQYKGTLRDGTEFDSNFEGKPPYSVVLGEHGVIPGWEQGLIGMKKGGVRKLDVPWQLGYGEQGSGTIPPKTDLLFEVRLLELVKQGEENYVDTLSDKEGSGPAAATGDTVTVKFTGKLADGKIIDKEYSTKPKTFKLGQGIAANFLEYTITGMKKGGKRSNRIPPGASGYGPYPQFGGQIPAHSVLFYDVELLDLKKK